LADGCSCGDDALDVGAVEFNSPYYAHATDCAITHICDVNESTRRRRGAEMKEANEAYTITAVFDGAEF
jgi:hypothetical protein